MKPAQTSKIISVLLFIGVELTAYSQGSFQNLNFEDAFVTQYAPGSSVPVGSAFPGWTAYYGSVQTGTNAASLVGYDLSPLSGPVVSINDSNPPLVYPETAISGHYSAALFGGRLLLPQPADNAAMLSQTALVPEDARSLQFKARFQTTEAVSLGGQVLELVPLAVFPEYFLLGADITPFAGQVLELRITIPPPPSGSPFRNFNLFDDFAFSNQIIPEPSVLGLLGLGALVLGRRVLRRRP